MSPRRQGSAAAARSATPRSAVRTTALRCAARLEHGIALARIIERSDPAFAARYLVDAVSAIRADLRVLRRASRSTS
jgi:hypothetical protein